MRVFIDVPGGLIWGRVQGCVGGAVFLWKIKEKGKGVGRVGGGVGTSKRNRQVNAQALSKLPFSKLPFSFSSISFCLWFSFLADFLFVLRQCNPSMQQCKSLLVHIHQDTFCTFS